MMTSPSPARRKRDDLYSLHDRKSLLRHRENNPLLFYTEKRVPSRRVPSRLEEYARARSSALGGGVGRHT